MQMSNTRFWHFFSYIRTETNCKKKTFFFLSKYKNLNSYHPKICFGPFLTTCLIGTNKKTSLQNSEIIGSTVKCKKIS